MSNKRFFAALLALGMMSVAAPAGAQSDTQGEIRFGGQWWNQNAPEAKFQEFRDVPQGGLLESFYLYNAQGRHAVLLRGVHALANDQMTALTYSNGARLRVDVSSAQVPHNLSWVSRTPYTQGRAGVFSLPDSLQRLNQDNPAAYVATMTDLLKDAGRIPLGFRTDVSKARVRARADKHWSLDVRGTRRQRSGSKAYGMAFGFNSAIELPLPISQRIIDADAVLEYRRPRVTVQGGAGVSQFINRVDRILLDNPKRLTDRTGPSFYTNGDGSAQGQLDLAPDNHTVRGNLLVVTQLPHQTIFSAQVAVSRAEQNDKWLPYTVNTAIPESALDSLPARSTKGEATVFTQDYRLTSRPWSRLSGTVRYHYDTYDNTTPEYTFTGGARLDQTWNAGLRTNDPFGNTQKVSGIDVDLDVARQITVGGLYEFRRRDRTFRELEQDDENVLGGHIRVRPASGLMLRADYRHGKREGTGFAVDDYRNGAGAFEEQPGLRRFDIADRIQNRLGTAVSWTPNPRLVFGGAYDFAHDNYNKSALGLRDAKHHLVAAYATVTPQERFMWTLGGGYERSALDQKSRESGATVVLSDTTSWTAAISDRNTYMYTSADWWAKPERLDVEVSYTFSRATGVYDLGNFKHTAVDLPDTRYDLQDVAIEARYHVSHDLEIAGRYAFERFDVNDFASENVQLLNVAAGGVSNAVFLGDSSLDYRAHRFAVFATQRF